MFRITLILIFLVCMPVYAYEPGKIVAIVGKEIITSQDLQDRMIVVKDTLAAEHANINMHFLEQQVLQSLIDDKIFIYEAKRLKLDVTDEDMKFALQMIEERNNLPKEGFVNYLKSRHIPKASVLEQIKAQIAWSKILNYVVRPRINISEKEVDEVLSHILPENAEITFRQITIPINGLNREAIDKNMLLLNELRAKIRNCEEAVNVAKKKNLSAQLMSVPINQLHEELRNMIMVTPRGTASKVIKTDDILSLIITCQRDYTGVAKKEREEIRDTLIQKKLSLQATHYLHELRKKAFIEIRM
ncbi:Peptidyl-prolyl cis-trans isomerase surA [Rickettsiales bacterium Ac37b]|nr:Peptidyl-prolyl cis-trans isomerase surA [Rickettsiales bacterium Ac37b]